MSAWSPGVVEAAPFAEPAPAVPEGRPELIAGPLVYQEGDAMADCLHSVRTTEHHYAAGSPRALGALTLEERRKDSKTLIAGGPWS
jgi:hypothetical protein